MLLTKLFRKGQQLQAGKIRGEHPKDSDLPDKVVFDVMDEMDELYKEDIDSLEDKVIKGSRKYPTVAIVRGTNNIVDWRSDAMAFLGKYDSNFQNHVNQIKKFLEENPQIEHIIGHSLGGATSVQAIKDNPRVKAVSLDGARVINEKELKLVRNINTNSFFDKQLDPYGPMEMEFPAKTYFKKNVSASHRVGHRAHEFEYRKKFRETGNKKRTGYFDGIIRYD